MIARTLLALAVVGSTLVAQGSRTVSGVISDSSTRQPLAGALVELRAPSSRLTERTDEEGNFRLRGVPVGRYQVSVLRIGYLESKFDLEIGTRDTVLNVSMRPAAQRLDAFRVRGDITAIYGMVGTLPDLLPIAGARVQVLGADKEQVTDSTGGFFIALKDPGTYMVRMTREGYAERMFPIDVPRNRAVEASRLMDPGQAQSSVFEGLFKDFDRRLRMRSTSNAVFVPGAEIRRSGSLLIDGLKASPSFMAKSLDIVDSACVFVDGKPRPGVSLEAFRPEEIEAVEVYARAAGSTDPRAGVPTGDRSNSLTMAWPGRAPCGRVLDRSFVPLGSGPLSRSTTGRVQYVVIWLRK